MSDDTPPETTATDDPDTPAALDEQPRVLVPVAVLEGETVPERLVEVLAATDVVVLGYHEIPEQTPAEQASMQFEERAREAVGDIAETFAEHDQTVETRVAFTHSREQTLDRVAAEVEATAVLLSNPVGDIEEALVPFRGAVDVDRLANLVATLFADRAGRVTLWGLATDEGDFDASDAVERARAGLQYRGFPAEGITTESTVVETPVRAIVDRAGEFDVVVMGEGGPSLLSLLLGEPAERVAEEAVAPVFVVRAAVAESEETAESREETDLRGRSLLRAAPVAGRPAGVALRVLDTDQFPARGGGVQREQEFVDQVEADALGVEALRLRCRYGNAHARQQCPPAVRCQRREPVLGPPDGVLVEGVEGLAHPGRVLGPGPDPTDSVRLDELRDARDGRGIEVLGQRDQRLAVALVEPLRLRVPVTGLVARQNGPGERPAQRRRRAGGRQRCHRVASRERLRGVVSCRCIRPGVVQSVAVAVSHGRTCLVVVRFAGVGPAVTRVSTVTPGRAVPGIQVASPSQRCAPRQTSEWGVRARHFHRWSATGVSRR
jgi:nucleotide-binding universal stress UspA family protein